MKPTLVLFLALLVTTHAAEPASPPTPPSPATPATPPPARGGGGGGRGALPAMRTDIKFAEISLHDPFILAHAPTRTYYLYTSAGTRTGQNRGGTFAYKSKDLATWSGPHLVFVVPDDSWAAPREGPWAPEVHEYKGKYYLFTTLHNAEKKLPSHAVNRQLNMRATIIARSDSPDGPFTLIKTDAPVTPPDFMTLDGTLYVDKAGKPWMVYAHEWTQKNDGTFEAIPLKDDLSDADGAPIFLWKGSDAPWLPAQTKPSSKPTIYVTDGAQFYRSKTGQLLCLWSSYEKNTFNRDGYVETIARSKSGELQGPWEQLPPLVGNDSGHGMLFRTFEGQLMMVIHQPFNNARGKLYEMQDLGDNLRVTKFREDLSGPPLPPQQGQTPQ